MPQGQEASSSDSLPSDPDMRSRCGQDGVLKSYPIQPERIAMALEVVAFRMRGFQARGRRVALAGFARRAFRGRHDGASILSGFRRPQGDFSGRSGSGVDGCGRELDGCRRDPDGSPRWLNRPLRRGNRPLRGGSRSGRLGNRPFRQGNRPDLDGNRPRHQCNRPHRGGCRPLRRGNVSLRGGNRPFLLPRGRFVLRSVSYLSCETL